MATDSVEVCLEASELNIPGIYLIHDFVSAQEEEVNDPYLICIYKYRAKCKKKQPTSFSFY